MQDPNSMTKRMLAQVIVTALHGYDKLPSLTCARVVNLANERKKDNLVEFYPRAVAMLERRGFDVEGL